jgi:hypothetical protein
VTGGITLLEGVGDYLRDVIYWRGCCGGIFSSVMIPDETFGLILGRIIRQLRCFRH